MTVKELRECLDCYDDNAEVIVAVSDNTDEYYEYGSGLYDMWVEGDKDTVWDDPDITDITDRNPESEYVYIKVYR